MQPWVQHTAPEGPRQGVVPSEPKGCIHRGGGSESSDGGRHLRGGWGRDPGKDPDSEPRWEGKQEVGDLIKSYFQEQLF